MSKRTKMILGAAVFACAAAAATQALAQQQTQAQPFVPYNGTNGAGPADTGGQNPNGPAPMHLLGVPAFPAYNGNTTANPACDRSSASYNPYDCR